LLVSRFPSLAVQAVTRDIAVHLDVLDELLNLVSSLMSPGVINSRISMS
jgi:hypothetical protein